MTNAPALFRSLLVYGICLPLALVLGYLVATPLDFTSFSVVLIVFSVLAVPVLLRWHHIWLIAVWNTTAVVFFVPGKPQVWMGLAAVSLGISILQYTINRNMKFLSVPSVAWPLLFFTVVVLITARLTGGLFAIRTFGGDTYGARRYFTILAAVIGYFAIISRRIPPERAGLYVALFFLGTATMAIASLPGVINPAFNFLFLIFPVTSMDSLTDPNSVVGPMGPQERIFGMANLGLAVFCLMLARYGLRGLLDLRNPWRLGVFCLSVVVAMFAGFRSAFILFVMTFAFLFYLERLHRTWLLLPVILVLLTGGGLLVLVASRLPYPVQRSLAFLPIPLDPVAKMDAQSSTGWRLQMWMNVVPDIPRYLLLGKGYSFNANDQARLTRLGGNMESFELVGDYHNGPLSVILPFGIFGSIAFVWLLFAGGRVIYQNYKFGDPAYHNINIFLFAYFAVKAVFFFTIFGSLHSDLPLFLGLLGLSISLNGGVVKPVVET
jgi:hypothetical protein